MRKLKNSYHLALLSLEIIKNDLRLIGVQFLGLTLTLAILALVWLVANQSGIWDSLFNENTELVTLRTSLAVLLAFVLYFSLMTIHYFTEAYSVSLSLGHIRNTKTSFSNATRAVRRNFVGLLQFTGISSTIGVLLKLMQDRLPWAGDIATYVAQGAWDLATVFAIPHLVDDEKQNGIEATRKSVKTFKTAFGENMIVHIGVGAFMTLVILLWLSVFVILVPLVLVTMAESLIMGATALGFGVVGLMVIVMVDLAIKSVLTSLLYEYAKKGNDLTLIDKELFKSMLTAKKAARVFTS